jgi:hypothetical protein
MIGCELKVGERRGEFERIIELFLQGEQLLEEGSAVIGLRGVGREIVHFIGANGRAVESSDAYFRRGALGCAALAVRSVLTRTAAKILGSNVASLAIHRARRTGHRRGLKELAVVDETWIAGTS